VTVAEGMTAAADDLLYDDLIAGYTSSPDYIHREWLESKVAEQLGRSDCRYVLLVGEPGVGKTGVMAGLAQREPASLRYFIRRDSTTPLSGGDAASMLLRIGHQLAYRRPELFDLDLLEIVVTQRIEKAHGREIVGARIDDLRVSPFRKTAVRVEQAVGGLAASAVGVEIAQATVEPRLLEPDMLQYLALIDPAAALEIPMTDSPIVGAHGYVRGRALAAAAVALAPYDLPRAQELAALAGSESEDARDARDRALAVAALAAPEAAVELLEQMSHGVAGAAVEAAEQAEPGQGRTQLLDLAQRRLEAEEPAKRLELLARLAAAWNDDDPQRAAEAAEALREVAQAPPYDDDDDDSFDWLGALVGAARLVRPADPGLAAWLLERVRSAEADSSSDDWALMAAARDWAVAGETAKAREAIERLLEHYRGLGWYGPADEIARAAVIADIFDPGWAEELADEAMRLVEDAAQTRDPFERSRVDGTLSGIVSAFLPWDLDRALGAARTMTGGWIPGGGWRTTDGALSALAVIGLEVADEQPELANALLAECLREDEPVVPLGRRDARLVHGGLFRPAEEGDATASMSRATNFIAYLSNVVEYWVDGRSWRAFLEPAEVARSIEMAPGTNGAFPSWAGAAAACVTPVAAADLDAAIDLVGRIREPCERVIALAAVVAALGAVGDARSDAAVAAFDRAVGSLPAYVPELDLAAVPQGPAIAYLDPSARARFEAALLLPPELLPKAEALLAGTQSWYLDATFRAQLVWELVATPAEGATTEDIAELSATVTSARDYLDDLQADLLRSAGVWALAPHDAAAAEAVAGEVANPRIASLARLYAHARQPTDGAAFARDCRAVLDDLPSELSPLHRATLAATAASMADDAEGSAALTDWGCAALDDADPVETVFGLASLAQVAETPRCEKLLRACLDRSADIGNEYLRSEALTQLLPPALASGDARLVTDVTRRLIDTHWQALVEGLRGAAAELIAAAGPGIVLSIDDAMRKAQHVLSEGAEVGHLDGVSAPDEKEDPLAPPAMPEPAPSEDGAGLYLESDDLPAHLQLVQDSRGSEPEPDDFAFAANGGTHAGLRAWMGGNEDAIWRVVDIRFAFPDAERASAYHAARLSANSEGRPPVADAPLIGNECNVFGGTHVMEFGAVRLELTAFFYVFRVDRVAAKLFVAQGPSAQERLTVEAVAPLAAHVAERLERQLQVQRSP
jgi:hypothetical protein